MQKWVLRKCCRVSQKLVNAGVFKHLPLCSAPLNPYYIRYFWSSRNERRPLSMQKCVLTKCCGISQKWWMLDHSNLCYCFQHPRKLTAKDFWNSRNDIKPPSQQKCVLRQCCGVSQKWWMLDLWNLCYCVHHPRKLTANDFWNSSNRQKSPFSAKMCLEKMLWGISETVNARVFKPLPLCSAHLNTY